MRAVRFLTLLGMALILGLAFAHVAELPGKLRLTGPDWLTVQHNLYIGFGAFAAVAEPLTILLAWILCFACARGQASPPRSLPHCAFPSGSSSGPWWSRP